mgnify:CR=1 FL=1
MNPNVIKLNKKIQNLQENGEMSISKLSSDERKLLTSNFAKSHHTLMGQTYPKGVLNLSETEKNCFEFINSLNFDGKYSSYSIDGQASRLKSQFIGVSDPNDFKNAKQQDQE